MRSSLRSHEDYSRIVVQIGSVRKRPNVLKEAFGGCASAHDVTLQPFHSVVVLLGWLFGLGDSIAVKNNSATFWNRNGHFGEVTADQTQWHPSLRRQEASTITVYQEWRQMSCACKRESALSRIQNCVNHGYELAVRKIIDHEAVQLGEHFAGTTCRFCQRTQHPASG